MRDHPLKTAVLSRALPAAAAILGFGALGSHSVWSADPDTAPAAQAPKNGTIAFVLTNMYWDIYSEDLKTECPHGLNKEGNREEFKQLFPNDGTQRTLAETQLRREIDGWYPTTAPDAFPF